MALTKAGDRVKVHYTGKFEDGSVFDCSTGMEPLEFEAGGNDVIPGVSNAVIGMQPGDTKTVVIAPEDGYGERQEGLDQKVGRDVLPPNVDVGMPLQAELEDRTIVVWVTELDEDYAVLDANHPLAGKTLTFDLEMVSNEG